MTASKIDVEKLFLFIGASYNELNEILISAVSKHAVEDTRAGGTSNPNIALRNILSNDLPALRNIKSTSIECNSRILFTDNERRKLSPSIEISKMDCSLLLDLLLRFPGLMKTNNNFVGFMCVHKTNTCCEKCDHSSTSCTKKNCRTKCNHACVNCHRLKSECNDYSSICNGNCRSCLQCNIRMFKRFFQTCNTYLLQGDINKFKETVQNSSKFVCPSFMYHYCWEMALELRNFYAHSNAAMYVSFLSGFTTIKIGDIFFRNVENLKGFLHTIFQFLFKHITDPIQIHVSVKTKEYQQMELNIDSIFKDGEGLTTYVYKNVSQIRERSEMLQDSVMLSKILEAIHIASKNQAVEILQGVDTANKIQTEEIMNGVKTLHDDQSVMIEQNVKVVLDSLDDVKKSFTSGKETFDNASSDELEETEKNYRTITGGVVLQMDWLEDDEEITEVSYCTNENQEYFTVINHKSRLNRVGEYYEVHKLNPSAMALKIENMPDGDYVIRVITKSQTMDFNVAVNYNCDNPTKLIGKIAIQVPSVNSKRYWDRMINNIYKSSKNGEQIMTWSLSKGACTTTQSLKEFEIVGADYFQRNFLEGYVCFPKKNLLEDDDPTKQMVEFFEGFLKERYVRGKRVILVSPNIAHLSKLVSTNQEPVDGCDQQRDVMVCVEELCLLLVVRVASCAEDIKEQLADCRTDVLRLSHIHGHKLKEEELKLVGMVACPTVGREQLKNILPFQFADVNDKLYESLFICSEDLHSKTNWWDAFLVEIQGRFGRNQKTESGFLKEMIGLHMASIASMKEGLPCLSSETIQQLDTVILNDQQLTCLKSINKKKLVIGPFGSGKTLLAQGSVKKIIETLTMQEEPSTVFYITCDEYSIVDRHVQKCMGHLSSDKVKLICGSMHELYRQHVNQNEEKTPRLDTLIKVLIETFPDPHFVCDEMASTILTLDVANSINGYFKTILKDSYVVFIKQSIKKDRAFKQHSLEADHFNQLNGMEIHNLKHVMRLTVETQKLVTVAQNVIKKTSLKVAIPKSESSEPDRLKPARKFESTTVTAIDTVISPATPSSSVPSRNDTFDPVEEKISKNVISIPDFDSSLKFFSRTKTSRTNENTLTTSIDFVNGKCGHDIKNKRAQLIYLPKNDALDDTCVKVIHLILNNCGYHGKYPVLIADSLQSANVLNRAAKACEKNTVFYIPYLQRRIPTASEKDKLIGAHSSVLITDHKSFLGMEHEAVMTIVDPAEEIARHSLVEIISRCTSYLWMFVLSNCVEEKTGTVAEILDGWIKNGVVDTLHVKLETGDEDGAPIEICEGAGHVIINTASKTYTELSDVIHGFLEEDLQLHLTDEEAGKFLNEKILSIEIDKSKEKIFTEFTYNGKLWYFEDVYTLLRKSRFNAFNKLLQFKPNILNNLRLSHSNETLLMQSCRLGHRDVIEFLLQELDETIDVMATNERGATIYHYAAVEDNKVDIMRNFVTFDPSGINVTDYDNSTPLHEAASNNSKRMVDYLLSEGCDVNIRDVTGKKADELPNVFTDIKRNIRKYRKNYSSS